MVIYSFGLYLHHFLLSKSHCQFHTAQPPISTITISYEEDSKGMKRFPHGSTEKSQESTQEPNEVEVEFKSTVSTLGYLPYTCLAKGKDNQH